MTAEEIRKERDKGIDIFAAERKDRKGFDCEIAFWLGIFLPEIAAQLAEYNERAARQEPFALKIAEKSLAMMERTEKACAELDRKESCGSSKSKKV